MARLRMIAGPNGSGKTQLTNELRTNYDLDWGTYINADDVEKTLRETLQLSFKTYNLNVTDEGFEQCYMQHPLRDKAEARFIISQNQLSLHAPLENGTYFPTLLTDYIRQEIMEARKTFSFETVMSGSDKLKLLSAARLAGYRLYLYFICTEDPLINIDRVADRVKKKGHHVPAKLIEDRYRRTLSNLWEALKLVDRAYLFDNSGREHRLVAEMSNRSEIKFNITYVPGWFKKHVLSKL